MVAVYRNIIRQSLEETETIQRASLLASENLQSHVRNIRNKFEGTRTWARGVVEDHENALRDWPTNLQVLGKVPAKRDFAFLLRRPSTPTKKKAQLPNKPSQEDTLRAFIDEQNVERAASELNVAAHNFKSRLEEVTNALEEISADAGQIEIEVRPDVASLTIEDSQSLYDDVEMLQRKIGNDHEELLRLPENANSIPVASRRALVHTRDLLPSLQNLGAEISHFARQAVSRRNSCLEASTQALRAISIIQSGLGDLQWQTSNLGVSPEGMEAYEIVRSVFDLPIAYGSTLVESIRRSEWAERVQANADQINEELSAGKDEEFRRRKRWLNRMGGLINDVPGEVAPGVELNLARSGDTWPFNVRQEVFDYIEALRNAQLDDAAQQVGYLLKELESSKPAKKVARAFKSGSVYEAELAIDRSSVFLEDEDEAIRALRNEKSRLEDRLRASDSRVRKLEDLLHRQSQMSRPTSAHFGPSPSEPDRPPQSPVGVPSPRPHELTSRRSSISSRRLSSNQNPDDKLLVQRIVGLEADLRTERDTVLKLQREAQADRQASTESRDRMNEAETTKKDLLANLEAQRQEFDDERHLLEDEMHKLKIRLEEAEDELDRVLGSRDHQKTTSDKVIVELQSELDRLRRSTSEEVSEAKGQTEVARNDLLLQLNRANALEKQLRQLKEEFSTLRSRNLSLADELRDQAAAQLEYVSSLQAAHSHLSPGGVAPEDHGRLALAIEILSEGLAIHARSSEEASQLASAENRSLEEQVVQTKSELEQARTKLVMEERETFTLRETVAQERRKLASLRAEFADAQSELRKVRANFAAGETGSEVLKARVSDEERKVADLTEKLAVAASNTQTFEQEILVWKDRVQHLSAEAKRWKDRLDVRGVRAKDLSQRLLSYNDRMVRMLEQMGYSIVCQDDQLVIQRASKVNASIVLAVEGSTSMKRSLSGQSPAQHYSNATDLDTLYWMSDSDATSEDTKFQRFIASLSRLDIEVAADMIAKRYKDIETLARKYQKESRAYREKAHRLQSEVHDKIAYRSFKEGDLALFLPTRNQATRPWAAFNVGAPHYFLREQDIHMLQARDWLLARISRVEERVVDLSRSLPNGHQGKDNPTGTDLRSTTSEASDHGSSKSVDDENPFELSDGLRWYLVDASEEKPGAVPVLTPGLGKSTVAATNVDAKGSIRLTKEGKKLSDPSGSGSAAMATKTLSRSLDSRRSSSTSKKGHAISPNPSSNLHGTNESAIADASSRPASSPTNPHQSAAASVAPAADSGLKADGQHNREDAPIFEAVRKDLLFGP